MMTTFLTVPLRSCSTSNFVTTHVLWKDLFSPISQQMSNTKLHNRATHSKDLSLTVSLSSVLNKIRCLPWLRFVVSLVSNSEWEWTKKAMEIKEWKNGLMVYQPHLMKICVWMPAHFSWFISQDNTKGEGERFTALITFVIKQCFFYLWWESSSKQAKSEL